MAGQPSVRRARAGFSTDLVAEKAINWIKQQDSNQPFLMCCHFKATHEPYDYPTRMEHLYDGVTFPEPENFLDWGPETNGRSFKGQTLEELGHRWRVASKDPDKWWCRYPGLPFNTDGMQRTTARRAIYQKLIRDYLRCGATIDDNIGNSSKHWTKWVLPTTPSLFMSPTKVTSSANTASSTTNVL